MRSSTNLLAHGTTIRKQGAMTRYRHTETLTWEDDNPNVDGTRTLLLQVVQGRSGWRNAKVLGTWEPVDRMLLVGDVVVSGGHRAMVIALIGDWVVISFADPAVSTAPVVVDCAGLEPI